MYEDEAGCAALAGWLPGCCLGITLGLWLGDVLARRRFPPPEHFQGLFAPLGSASYAALHLPIILAGGAVGLGLAQTVVMLPALRPPRWPWALASLAVPVPLLALALVPMDPFDFFWVLLFTGAGTGTGQYFVLDRVVEGAGWWILASALAWPLALIAAFLAADAVGEAVSAVLVGLVFSAITGCTLLFLLDRPR